jgi:hypothetical protein
VKRKFFCNWSKAREYLFLPRKETQKEKIGGESLKKQDIFRKKERLSKKTRRGRVWCAKQKRRCGGAKPIPCWQVGRGDGGGGVGAANMEDGGGECTRTCFVFFLPNFYKDLCIMVLSMINIPPILLFLS